jgi:hypothetical protein
MPTSISQVANTDTFYKWLTTVNLLANAMSTIVVTTQSSPATGDASVTGNLNSSSLVVNNSISLSNGTANTIITIPTTAQYLNGNYFLNANGSWTFVTVNMIQGSANTSGLAAQVIDSYPLASYKAAEYMIWVKDNNANNYYTTKLLTMNDGTNGYITEYGSILSNNNIGYFSASSNSTSFILNFTPTSTNTTVNYTRVIS